MTANPYNEDHLVEREGEERRRLDALVAGCDALPLGREAAGGWLDWRRRGRSWCHLATHRHAAIIDSNQACMHG